MDQPKLFVSSPFPTKIKNYVFYLELDTLYGFAVTHIFLFFQIPLISPYSVKRICYISGTLLSQLVFIVTNNVVVLLIFPWELITMLRLLLVFLLNCYYFQLLYLALTPSKMKYLEQKCFFRFIIWVNGSYL